MRIGVDLLGSDGSIETLLNAVISVAEKTSRSCQFIVFTTNDIPKSQIESLSDSVICHFVTESITMDDDPLTAVRRKRGSSLITGIKLLKDKKLDAFVSAGNTGALIAGSQLLLPKLPFIDRLALLALLPTKKSPVALVDVGGTVDFQPNHLLQFAQMGIAYQHCHQGHETPRVGLLNIGVESKKGTKEHRETYSLLSELKDIEFVGNIEGREVFDGVVDVVVTDGFSGNVLLKTAEGVSNFIFSLLREKLSNSQNLSQIQNHFSYDSYPGAIVCGIDGIVIKCHGKASQLAMENSILEAVNLCEQKLVDKLKSSFIS